MTFLASAEFLGELPDLQDISPWLAKENPVWHGPAPLGVFLSTSDRARYGRSAFSGVMDVLSVPVSSGESLAVFCAAALAAKIEKLTGEAHDERAAAAAMRKDFMQLQENFLSVEAFLNGVLAPRFVLAREWPKSGQNVDLKAGDTLAQALPVSSSALVAIDIWIVSGAVSITLLHANESRATVQAVLSGVGWQRMQFQAIDGPADDVSILIEAQTDAVLGLSHPCALPEFGPHPLAVRMWKGLHGVRLPDIAVTAQPRSFFLPADLPKAEILDSGSVKFLETENILMIQTDYYGAAHLALRGTGMQAPARAHIQNCGPTTLEVTFALVAAGASAPAKYCPSIFLAPEAYMHCEIVPDGPDVLDIIIKIKGQTSLDCLSLRGFEID